MKLVSLGPFQKDSKRGAVLVLVAILLVVLLGIVSLAVDLGYFFVTRNELADVSDASSLAATRLLGDMYQGLTPAEQQEFYCYADCVSAIKDTAQVVAQNNRAAGVDISLLEDEIRIGRWDGDTFEPNLSRPDAVEVTARRSEEINGAVGTFFARVLGVESRPVSAIAIAALTGQGTSGEGQLLFPVTLSEYFFEGEEDRCNDYIKFSPTDSTSCGGWTTWDETSNADLLRDILDGDDVSPEMTANTSRIWTTGGDVASAFPNMLMLFQRQGCATDDTPERNYLEDADGCVTWEEARDGASDYPWLEEDEHGNMVQAYYPDWDHPTQPDLTAPRYYHKWETTVPVYDYAEGGADECSNPGQRTKWLVVGFAPVIITDVIQAPDKIVQGKVLCNLVSPDPNRGGGGEYGIKGSIPGLVK